jgi:hypothetical protein
MKKHLMLVLCLIVSACSSGESGKVDQQAKASAGAEAAPVVEHYYSLKDGYEYGYEQGISVDQENSGQVAPTLAMFKYSGKKDGVHQVYMKNNKYMSTVVECADPCEYIKVMGYMRGEGAVSTERIKAVPGSLAYGVIYDAINGKLEQFVGERDGKKYTLWLGEKKPLTTYLE